MMNKSDEDSSLFFNRALVRSDINNRVLMVQTRRVIAWKEC